MECGDGRIIVWLNVLAKTHVMAWLNALAMMELMAIYLFL
jgi:hypothetical protein